jgi:hypothetical protein
VAYKSEEMVEMAMGFYQQNLDEINYKVRVDMDDMEFTL